MAPNLAWHFVEATLRDGRPIPPDGEWLVHDGPLKLCSYGLHCSIHPFDALRYAPGPVLCRVEYGGEVITDTDKLVCSLRRIIARRDITDLLRRFAREQALSVIHLWDAPDIVRKYLETGDESLSASAWAAAWAAAWATAGATAGATARAAAGAAAGATARVAAGAAAWDAAGAAAREAARKRFSEMVNAEFAGDTCDELGLREGTCDANVT